MVSSAYAYRLSEAKRTYCASRSNSHEPECTNCDLELKVGDGVVSKGRGRGSARQTTLYCAFCALKKGIVLISELEDKFGPPETWITDPYNRIKKFDEKIKTLRAKEKEE